MKLWRLKFGANCPLMLQFEKGVMKDLSISGEGLKTSEIVRLLGKVGTIVSFLSCSYEISFGMMAYD